MIKTIVKISPMALDQNIYVINTEEKEQLGQQTVKLIDIVPSVSVMANMYNSDTIVLTGAPKNYSAEIGNMIKNYSLTHFSKEVNIEMI